eukprot:1160146-Pelagomonas_calceolata.AAC.18
MSSFHTHLHRELLRNLPALQIAGATEAGDGPHDLLGVGLVAAQQHNLKQQQRSSTICSSNKNTKELLRPRLVAAQQHNLELQQAHEGTAGGTTGSRVAARPEAARTPSNQCSENAIELVTGAQHIKILEMSSSPMLEERPRM